MNNSVHTLLFFHGFETYYHQIQFFVLFSWMFLVNARVKTAVSRLTNTQLSACLMLFSLFISSPISSTVK